MQTIAKKLNAITIRSRGLSSTDVCIDENDEFAYSCSKNGSITKYDIVNSKKIKELRTENGPFYSIIVFSSLDIVCVGSESGIIYIYPTSLDPTVQPERLEGAYGHLMSVTGLATPFNKDSDPRGEICLYSVSLDGTLKCWNIRDQAYLESYFGHTSSITSIDCLNTDNPITAGFDHSLRYWKIEADTNLRMETKSLGPLDCCCMLSQELFVVGGQDTNLYLMNRNRRKPIHTFFNAHGTGERPPPNPIGYGQFWEHARDITDEEKEELIVAALENDQTASSLAEKWITSLCSYPTDSMFFSGSNSGEVRLWKPVSKQNNIKLICKRRIYLDGFINAMKVTSDGKYLICALGQEHKFGRWTKISGVKNGISIIQLFE
eukprot:TRINITY_DN1998_c0_g1_i1.p1 TRINITY_DN1998_c0_g1~~TRINITY_DN1998_c0_g1_i1.p1  ORF type:complete len:386 (+),score=83.25 TRINITY_DN1998_c0_g1_i1:28-1158(+)